MLIESLVQLPVSFALLQEIFHWPDGASLARIFLRWTHFVAGITWIGLLYFFNLVNVPLQKEIDAEAKKKVNPPMLSRALWWFRWGAVVTVLAGLMYYAMYILADDTRRVNTIQAGAANTWVILLVWLLIAIITFFIIFAIINKVPALTKDGRVLAVVIALLVILMAVAIVYWLDSSLTVRGDHQASNKTHSIGIGGALGIIMMLNVWGIIWPAQKRIIAGTVSGNPAPPELARRAFLASRANAWLSLPMLLFMGTSHGDWIILGR